MTIYSVMVHLQDCNCLMLCVLDLCGSVFLRCSCSHHNILINTAVVMYCAFCNVIVMGGNLANAYTNLSVLCYVFRSTSTMAAGSMVDKAFENGQALAVSRRNGGSGMLASTIQPPCQTKPT